MEGALPNYISYAVCRKIHPLFLLHTAQPVDFPAALLFLLYGIPIMIHETYPGMLHNHQK